MTITITSTKDRSRWLALRHSDVTASQVGALFGKHDYVTPYELWAIKTGRGDFTVKETEAMERGTFIEPAAVEKLRRDHKRWKLTYNAKTNTYYREVESRMGGTPDVIVEASDRGRGVVQIKSVEPSVFRRNWMVGDEIEVPLWIILQATVEAYLTGAQWAAVMPVVLSFGVQAPLIEVPLKDGVIAAIKGRIADFWRMIEEGREPAADYALDGDAIAKVAGVGDPDHEIDLTSDNRIGELLINRQLAAASLADQQAIIDEIDAEVMHKLGEAHVAHIAGGQRITWKPQRREGHFVKPSVVRALRYPKLKD